VGAKRFLVFGVRGARSPSSSCSSSFSFSKKPISHRAAERAEKRGERGSVVGFGLAARSSPLVARGLPVPLDCGDRRALIGAEGTPPFFLVLPS
jgi:hypothetical protein